MPLPEKEQHISHLPMREDVFRKLLHWIMDGTLQPGEKIVDKELAEYMGVSRTPVREAIHRLEDKGFVESAANRWTRVSEIPPTEAEMIYPIIWTLETLALSISISSLTEDDLAGMEKANNELKRALEGNDPEAASRADKKFHSIFIERSKNFHLINILEDLKVRYRRLEVQYFEGLSIAESSVLEHKKLISAFKAGDSELANKILISNWKRNLERFAALKETAGKPEPEGK
ncbi:MAG: GntR family transcriptional regulator [Desulfobulbaceae bacterium]|nr:GntR family transcriptional regulator [Desulfobulbaceae bacterium]